MVFAACDSEVLEQRRAALFSGFCLVSTDDGFDVERRLNVTTSLRRDLSMPSPGKVVGSLQGGKAGMQRRSS